MPYNFSNIAPEFLTQVNEREFQIFGAGVIEFIANNQNNVQLLEDLAHRVMSCEQAHEAHHNQPISSVTWLHHQHIAKPGETELTDGALVSVHYYKANDPKDVTGWTTRRWFLPARDFQLYAIWELEETKESPVVEEKKPTTLAAIKSEQHRQIFEGILGQLKTLFKDDATFLPVIAPFVRNGANDVELDYEHIQVSVNWKPDQLVFSVLWNPLLVRVRAQPDMPDYSFFSFIIPTKDRGEDEIALAAAKELVLIYSKYVSGYLKKITAKFDHFKSETFTDWGGSEPHVSPVYTYHNGLRDDDFDPPTGMPASIRNGPHDW